MASPREMSEARRAPDRWTRTRRMAEFVRGTMEGGAVTVANLRQQGFTDAEIFGYSDDVRSLISDRPGAGEPKLRPARVEGLAMVAEARRIRAEQAGATDRQPTEHRDETPDVRTDPAEGPASVVERFRATALSILDDLAAENLILVPRAELDARDRREAELRQFQDSVEQLLGGLRSATNAPDGAAA